MKEIYFIVTGSEEIGFIADAIGHPIHIDGGTIDQIREQAEDEAEVYFEEEVKAHLVKLVAPEEDPVVKAVLKLLRDSYEPATSLSQLDTFFTTDDIADALTSIYPGFTTASVAQLLIRSGFRLAAVPADNMQFVWMIKRR